MHMCVCVHPTCQASCPCVCVCVSVSAGMWLTAQLITHRLALARHSVPCCPDMSHRRVRYVFAHCCANHLCVVINFLVRERPVKLTCSPGCFPKLTPPCVLVCLCVAQSRHALLATSCVWLASVSLPSIKTVHLRKLA